MITDPGVENRSAKHYIGIRTQVPMQELPAVIPQMFDRVYNWLEQQHIQPVGAPFVRYHVIDMANKLDIEMGVPVPEDVAGEGEIQPGKLPAGRYAALRYTGDYSGLMDANRVLIEWAQAQHIAWDRWDCPEGDAFAGRYETYITDPGSEPDPAKWETEVAIKVAESRG